MSDKEPYGDGESTGGQPREVQPARIKMISLASGDIVATTSLELPHDAPEWTRDCLKSTKRRRRDTESSAVKSPHYCPVVEDDMYRPRALSTQPVEEYTLDGTRPPSRNEEGGVFGYGIESKGTQELVEAG